MVWLGAEAIRLAWKVVTFVTTVTVVTLVNRSSQTAQSASLVLKTSLQTLPDATPPEGKIHPFSKIAINFWRNSAINWGALLYCTMQCKLFPLNFSTQLFHLIFQPTFAPIFHQIFSINVSLNCSLNFVTKLFTHFSTKFNNPIKKFL